MYEAVQTNVSAAGIWAIVAVSVTLLAFWLTALAIASRDPGVGRPHRPGLPGPVLGGIHVSDCARSVAPSRDSAATFADAEADALAAGATVRPAPGAAPMPSPRAADQPAGTQTGQPSPTAAQAMPGQRTGDTDQPRRTGSRHEGL